MDLDISIRLNTFLSFENEGIGYIQFNGEIMMLPAKFAWIFNSQGFDTYLTQPAGYSI